MRFDIKQQEVYLVGQRNGLLVAAEKVRDAFNDLPSTADSSVKDLLLDLYNEITGAAGGVIKTDV